jgi:hypothetical protein
VQCNISDGGPARNARRQNAGEANGSDLMRKVGERSCQKTGCEDTTSARAVRLMTPVQSRTADVAAGGYTGSMASETLKPLLLVAWLIAVSVAAIAIGVTSVPNWIVVACAVIVPSLVVRQLWRAPEQTISESIHEARR